MPLGYYNYNFAPNPAITHLFTILSLLWARAFSYMGLSPELGILHRAPKNLTGLDKQIFIYNNNTQVAQIAPIHMIKAWKTPKRYIENNDI